MINHLLEHSPGEIGMAFKHLVEASLVNQVQPPRFGSGSLFE
jgi:hypothetical protein